MKRFAIILASFTLSSFADPIEDIQLKNASARATAVRQLAKGASPSQVQQLIQLLETVDDNGVRASCANALGNARETSAVPALLVALKVPDWRVRRSTATALGRIGDPRAIDPLIEILTEEVSDPNLSEGRRCAINAFENLRSRKVVPVLLHMLTHNPGRDKSERIDYTTAVLAALGVQKDKRAIPVLADYLDGHSASQAAATIGAIVGVDFDDDETRGLPRPSPAKAKAWLQEHPEMLKQEDMKEAEQDGAGQAPTAPESK
jgi:HEAT repeat protein